MESVKTQQPTTSPTARGERDFQGYTMNGFVALVLFIILLIAAGVVLTGGISNESGTLCTLGCIVLVCLLVAIKGFIQQEPNEARVMMFFGQYKGTFKRVGYYWVNPFISTKRLSLRSRNIDAEPIKVNDKQGNPVMIGLVLVWRLKDTYKAMFEIDAQTMATGNASVGANVNSIMGAFENFVKIQSDAALRQVAGLYSYDSNESDDDVTLRDGSDIVNKQLEARLDERLDMAGIEIVEARINYLAYAPEIAAVMLRRQQADAIIAAREKIVQGAVGMVKTALDKLAEEQVVELDDDKKATMVSNLLVVLCGDESAQPVVNTGTLNM